MLKKYSQKGFTIVELLIVIVIIGILALLVLNTFNGVQEKARNTERQTDIKAIASQLETYYADKGSYPTFSQFSEASGFANWRRDNLKGLAEGAAVPPQQTSAQIVNSATPTKGQYGYMPDATAQTFVLYYQTEGNPAPAVTQVKSLNQ